MSYMTNKDSMVSFRIGKLDLDKMKWLAQHDDTPVAQQFRQAIRTYLHNRKRSVYAIFGKDPINDQESAA